MTHYIYKITNIETGQYYLGVRSTSKPVECDCYMGSSSVWTKAYIIEHKDILRKEILDSSFESRELANIAEKSLIIAHINDPKCINRAIPGEDFTQFNNPCSEYRKRLYSKLYKGEGNPFYGKHHTEDSKQKQRATIGDSRKKELNTFYGKHHTEEALELNRQKHLGINNKVSLPVKYTNLLTKEVLYFGSLNLCVKYIGGSWVPFKKQVVKGRPYKEIHFAEFISREEFLEKTN